MLLQQRRHQRQRTAALERDVQGVEAAGVDVPGRGVVAQCLQCAQACAAQARGQRGTQDARILGVQHRVQDQAQLARGGGVEHALLRARHAGHAARLEHHRQLGELRIAGQQHGDVAGFQRLVTDAVAVFRQCPGDLPRTHAQRVRFEIGRIVVWRDPVQHQRTGDGRVGARGAQRRVVAPAAGLHVLVADGSTGAGRPQRPASASVELVDRLDIAPTGAVIGIQREPVFDGDGLLGPLIGRNVAAAEAVDRLLGIADHHQPPARRAIGSAVDRIEDAELHRVGILELVHQRHRPGGKQRIGQRPLPVAGCQRVAHRDQQLVEAGLVGGVQACLQRGAAPALGGGEELAKINILAAIDLHIRDLLEGFGDRRRLGNQLENLRVFLSCC